MKLSRCLFSVVLLLGLAGTLWAQAAPAPAPTAMTKTVVIHAGHLLDVKTGKTLANQTILIQGDKIASVGSDAQVPAGAQVIDLPNATVLPGLIDAHTHLTMNPNFGYSMLGDFRAAAGADWSAQRAGHARSGIYHGSQRGCLQLCRRGVARCRQRGRRARAAHAGERSSVEHYGRTLR